jgi:hypothetical protein
VGYAPFPPFVSEPHKGVNDIIVIIPHRYSKINQIKKCDIIAKEKERR